MSFGATEAAFKVLALAQPGETYEVDVVKNTKGYNDWTSMVKAGVVTENIQAGTTGGSGRSVQGATSTARSSYETTEERAKRQGSIVRQSSLSNAIATLAVGAKSVDPDKVIEVAKKYETYVNSNEIFSGGATGFDDVPNFDPTF
jgi:hypothetical protein